MLQKTTTKRVTCNQCAEYRACARLWGQCRLTKSKDGHKVVRRGDPACGHFRYYGVEVNDDSFYGKKESTYST